MTTSYEFLPPDVQVRAVQEAIVELELTIHRLAIEKVKVGGNGDHKLPNNLTIDQATAMTGSQINNIKDQFSDLLYPSEAEAEA